MDGPPGAINGGVTTLVFAGPGLRNEVVIAGE
jgi:hypothetical protein